MQKSGETVEFVYNENGLRVQKTATSTGVTKYTLHGKNIVHMTQGSNNLHFFYDASNKPAIVEFNGTKYAYVHNLQGDIVAILDSNGTAVVQYKYDAWGRPISKTGTLAATLGAVQPFRYRGYVFDEETKLYYLRNRYYHASCFRFLNVDIYLHRFSPQIQTGAYVYCRNNAVNTFDPNGTTESSLSMNDFYNGDNNWSLYDSRRHKPHGPVHEQILSLSVSAFGGEMDPWSGKASLTLGYASLDLYTVGWEFEVAENVDVDLSLFDFGHAEIGVDLSQGIEVSAFVSAYSPSVSATIHGVTFEASAEICSAGFVFKVSSSGIKFARGGLLGFSFEISW